MKGFKGFDKDLKCRGKQYEIGRTEHEDDAVLCESGMHFCTNPHDVFNYYSPGEGHRFCEISASEVSDRTESDSKRVCKTLKVEAEISVFQICRIAVRTFFENFGFRKKMESSDTNNAGNYGAANAGKVKGGIGSVLVLVNRDVEGNIIEFKAVQVDGKKVKPDTWYKLENGKTKKAE